MNRFLITLLLMATTLLAGGNSFISGGLNMKMPSQMKLDASKPGNFFGTLSVIDVYTEELEQDWNTSLSSWVTVSKEIVEWDSVAGSLTTTVQDTIGGVLVNKDKYVMFLVLDLVNSTFRILKTEIYTWTSSGWFMQGRTIYNYDSNNYLLSVLTEFQLIPGTFLPMMRSTYTNNSAGNPELELTESYNMATSQWSNAEKSEYVYQTGNPDYMVSETQYDWESSAWAPYYKTLFTRNAQLNPTETIYQDYNNGAFENSNREVVVYLADGKKEDSIYYYYWSGVGSGWENSLLEIFTYNAAGDEDILYIKDWDGFVWTNSEKISFSYDAQNRETEELTQYWEISAYVNAFREISSYQVTSVKDESAPASFSLKNNYPNPFNPSTTIEYEVLNTGLVTLTVYNVLGQVVAVLQDGYQQAGVYTVQFDGTGLTSGVYLYELAAGNSKITKKMILNK